MRKIELFFRGEFWLHIATMFFAVIILIKSALLAGIYLPNGFLFPLVFVVAIAWELVMKKLKGTPINIYDMVATVIGGTLAIAIFRF